MRVPNGVNLTPVTS